MWIKALWLTPNGPSNKTELSLGQVGYAVSFRPATGKEQMGKTFLTIEKPIIIIIIISNCKSKMLTTIKKNMLHQSDVYASHWLVWVKKNTCVSWMSLDPKTKSISI